MGGDARADKGFSVYYLGHTNIPSLSGENRIVSLAATTKMEYIAKVLNDIGYNVDYVSMAAPADSGKADGGYYSISDHQTLRLWRARPRKTMLDHAINRIQLSRQTESFLSSLSPSDTVLCYHSLQFCNLLRRAKRRAGFKLILEVEELYSDVVNKPFCETAERRIFKEADSLLISTQLLAKRVGSDKPCTICSGIYEANQIKAPRRNDGRHHVVYAGTLDPRKGVLTAIESASYLDDSYALHILGAGSDSQVRGVVEAIDRVTAENSGCRVAYEGLKQGDDFDRFIQGCSIGLSPQSAKASFNQSSFPSKIFMYLSNGLKVVSINLPVFDSRMRGVLSIYETDTPEALAAAIRAAANAKSAPDSSILHDLDVSFHNELSNLMNG